MRIEPLTEADLDAAARLAASRHARARQQFPFLPEALSEPEHAKPHLAKLLARGETGSYAVREGDDLLGFAVGQPALLAPGSLMARYVDERSASIPLGAHGVAPGADAFAVYNALYAALARDWVRLGFLSHGFHIYGNESELHEIAVNLGFGRKLVTGVAPVHPIASSAAPVEIHRAAEEDLGVVMALGDELVAYHTEAPIFMPLDPLTRPAAEDFQRSLLESSANAHFVAYQQGKPVGMVTFQNPPLFLGPQVRNDGIVYLFEGVVSRDARSGGVGEALLSAAMDWLQDEGFSHCGLHYHAANPTGGPFWRKHGFAAVEHTMTRVLDSRLTWARDW